MLVVQTDAEVGTQFASALTRAVEEGLVAVALVDRNGRAIAVAGAITDEEAMPLAALVMYRLKSNDLAARLFTGEILSLALDDREIAVGVAKRQLFVVVVMGAATPAIRARVRELCDEVEWLLPDTSRDVAAPPLPPWSGGAGGSGSGPAELPLIELGITVRRPERGKA